MDTLLVNPPIREWAKPNCVPIGLAYIAQCLRNAGHGVRVLDINGYRYPRDEVVRILEREEPDLVLTGGIITVFNYVKWLIGASREIHGAEVPVMVGGSVSTSIPEIALSTLGADIACIGEGEVTTVEVADALEKERDLSGIRGIYYRRGDSIFRNDPRPPIMDMDTIPLPAYDLFPMEIYVSNPVGYINRDKWGSGERVGDAPRSTNINVSRGCPYRCGFCYHDYLGPGYRHRSPEHILGEMDLLHERYGVSYFLWADDESVVNRRFIHEFCDLMIRSGRDYQFSISGRVNLMTGEMLAELKTAGCTMVGYGIESGSQKILDAMNKGVTVEQAKRAVRLTQQIFGDADCSFIIGYPGETDETIRETEKFCRELDLAPEVIFFATAYPGTPLYLYARENGLIPDEVAYISKLWEQGERIAVNFTDWPDEVLFAKRQALIEGLKAWNRRRHGRDEAV
jgi:radical SAM superfamily enzyme YgiQ (UPF0313 family)